MGSPKAPDAPKTDYEGDIKSFVAGLKGSFPSVLNMEGKYRDKFAGLNLGDISSLLGGRSGEKGLTKLGGELSGKAGRQIANARASELRQMTSQAGATRGLLQSVSPESAAMVAQANKQAIAAQRAAQGLTGQEQRSAQQFAREGAADRGRVMDNSAMAAEILNRDNILGQKRQEASAATTNAYNLSNSFYSAPGLQALSAMPNSYQAGQSYLGMGLGGIGSARPQLVDVGAGLNLGAANRQNQFNADSTNAQIDAQNQNTKISAGAAVTAGALMMISDERLKTDKKKVGETNAGLPIYTYKMIGDPKTQMGVMAQDVQKKQPAAARKMPGSKFLGVRYDKIK
jgi:hypothetical protein